MFHSCYFILNVSVIVVDMFMHDTLGLLIIFRLVPFFPLIIIKSTQCFRIGQWIPVQDALLGRLFFFRYMDRRQLSIFLIRLAGWVCDHPLGHEVQERNS